ncbi:MAG: class I SAM-dependent methyltransferase [Gaiellaceae bacterium]
MTDRFDEDALVREQYAAPDNLRARKAAYVNAEGDDPRDFLFAAIAAENPRRVLEVGGGEGELAERIANELGIEVIGVDQSEGMVEIQRSKGIDARVGDVRALPFDDGDFDLAVAAWMLYHVDDLDGALAELGRVLEPGGVLVATTNSRAHMRELRDLAGLGERRWPLKFRSENGADALAQHFAEVHRRDAHGSVLMDDATIRGFAASSPWLAPLLTRPPWPEPIRAQTHSTVFVARKATP